MKKFLFYVAVAALALCAVSCGGNKEKAEKVEAETQEQTQPVREQVVISPITSIEDMANNDSSVVVLPSGLAYRVISEGVGDKPTIENTASVIYTGYHTDGSTFDSSNGAPVPFPLDAVVPGFTEGITLMSPGARYVLYLPGNLAYGERGYPGVIAPNETLIFDVELVSFE